MKRAVQRGAVMFGVLTAAAFAFVAPAQAAGRGDCPGEYICLWHDRDFAGSRWQGKNNNATLGSGDNQASSLFNNGQHCNAWVWSDTNYAGVSWEIPLGTYRAFLNSNPGPSPVGSWEDVISSVHWCSPR